MPKIDSQGRVTIPKQIRDALRLCPGTRIDFVEFEKGQFTMIPLTGSVQELKGLFKGKRKKSVTIEEMDAAIAHGVSKWR
jgi:antitoxin PrlF